MIEAKVSRVPFPEHPDRCQATSHVQGNQGSQCWNFKQEGSNFCAAHGGNRAATAAKKQSVSIYQIAQFQARLDDMIQGGGEENPVLGLRNEIGLLRMKLEAIINECKSASDLLIHSQKINMTVQLIGKLVTDAKKLESSLGQLLDKSTVINLCDHIIAIIGSAIQDPEKLEEIGGKIGQAIEIAVMRRVEAEVEAKG